MKWVSNGRHHKLVDSKGNVLKEVEDRTCTGKYINQEVLDQLQIKYLQEQKERESIQ